jgi:hypothetical protein
VGGDIDPKAEGANDMTNIAVSVSDFERSRPLFP